MDQYYFFPSLGFTSLGIYCLFKRSFTPGHRKEMISALGGCEVCSRRSGCDSKLKTCDNLDGMSRHQVSGANRNLVLEFVEFFHRVIFRAPAIILLEKMLQFLNSQERENGCIYVQVRGKMNEIFNETILL